MDALNVRMILLEFGGNATPYVTSDESVEDYKQMIARQIKYLKTHYPKAQILLIGPADMSMKIAGELQTYPFLEEIVSAMEEAALENGAYFWNMYQVMGGRNSMVKWVEHQPAWAASDYIHFTETGANKIAGYFVQSFMNYYDYYQFLKRNKEWSGVE
jgi:lysophospholipase L1-like esterase